MDPKKQATATLDDMVFENRFKEYGAFNLRTTYKRTVNRAMVIGGIAFVAALGAPFLFAKLTPKAKQQVAVEIDLANLKDEKKDEKPPELPPPPPPPEKPPEVAQVKFLPPEPKPDEEVKQEDPPPKVEEVENKVISNQNVVGVETDAVAPPPVEEAPKPAEIEKPREDEIFTTVEQQPEFPGGIKEMYGFLGKNIKYPPAAQRANVAGKVFVKFVVEKNGSIGDVQVLKGIGFGCDEEAIRVIKSMPRWSPGKQNGREVRVFYTMPVVYQLE